MAIIQIDETHRASRVSSRPLDHGALGHYEVAVVTGSVGAGAGSNSEIFQVRWTDANNLCVPLELECVGMIATTAFVAGSISIMARVARAFTVAGTGGNTVTLSGNNQKQRTSMGTSLMGEIRYASTAALGAGTKTLDSQDVGMIHSHSSGGWNSATPIIGSIYLPTTRLFKYDMAAGQHPLVLAQNEGLVVRATVPGTGVWAIGFRFKWAEVPSFGAGLVVAA